MSFNNSFMVKLVGENLDQVQEQVQEQQRIAFRKQPLPSEPCLIQRLPPRSFLHREGKSKAIQQCLLLDSQRPMTPPLEENNTPSEPDEDDQSDRESVPSSPVSASSIKSFISRTWGRQKETAASKPIPWKEPQPFEVFRAIEHKDIVYLMEVRDRAFPLLLRRSGDTTPLLHAMRIGQSHREVAIILLGAFSRYINNLQDGDIPKPQTKAILRALRTNLKLAIDFGLAKSQVDLTASFMQTLIMSEGDKWVVEHSVAVARILRAGKPVQEAEAAVRKFATRELGKADLIASLEDYVANATADLLILGAWSLVLESVRAESIPSYYFARDDRVFKAFTEALNKYKVEIQTSITRRLKWQLNVLQTTLDNRTITFRASNRKVEILSRELDDGGA
ncbi:hypothetical protein JOM56_008668 [Amanita muscaria]